MTEQSDPQRPKENITTESKTKVESLESFMSPNGIEDPRRRKLVLSRLASIIPLKPEAKIAFVEAFLLSYI